MEATRAAGYPDPERSTRATHVVKALLIRDGLLRLVEALNAAGIGDNVKELTKATYRRR